MKKRILIPVFAAFIAMTLNLPHALADNYKKVQITADSLNVRLENSTNSDVISKLSSGQEVAVVDTKDGWYKIKLSNGKEGWISSSYASLKSNYSIGSIEGDKVNLRQGASLESSSIGTLTKGSEVKILDKSGDWYKVDVNGQEGYIYASLVSTKEEKKSVTRGDSSRLSKLYEVANDQLGKKYVWAASGPDSFDCSGFTMYVYKTALGIDLPHSSKSQSTKGDSVSKDELQLGDLVFFDTDNDGDVSHVGIYSGDGKFIHSSSAKKKVMVSSLDEGFYLKTYIGARRIAD